MSRYKFQEFVFWQCGSCAKVKRHSLLLYSFGSIKLRCCSCGKWIRKKWKSTRGNMIILRQKYKNLENSSNEI